MEKVVYYARVSTEEEKQLDALDNQKLMLEDYIKSQENWVLVDQYVDEGLSGTESKKRKQYNRMFADLSTDKFDIIVIKDQSRLMRNLLDWYLFIDTLHKEGKKLFFYSDKKYYTIDNQLETGIKALVAADFSRDLSKRVRDGIRKKQEYGTVFGNDKIWGYDYKDGKLSINEDEAVIIRLIFDLYINNHGFKTIFKELEARGYNNRNDKPFSITTLKRIVKNEKYKGVLVANKKSRDFISKKDKIVPEDQWIVKEGIVPPIVSTEVWEKANEILKTKRRNNPNADKETIAGYFSGTHLYSSKIICGECGNTYWHTKSEHRSCWQCKEYKSFGLKKEGKKHGCINTKLRTEMLDTIMQQIVLEFWENKEDSISKVIEILDKVLEENTYYESIEKLERDKIKYSKRLEKFINMRADDELTKDQFLAKKTEIEGYLSKIDSQVSELKQKNESIITKKQRMLEIKDLIQKKVIDTNELNEDIISHFLSKIIVKSANEMVIYLKGGFEYFVDINTLDKNRQSVVIGGSIGYVQLCYFVKLRRDK
jgi:DNA invertase Pin-like site-specific DNA recombinase/predicted transcriptional regulator